MKYENSNKKSQLSKNLNDLIQLDVQNLVKLWFAHSIPNKNCKENKKENPQQCQIRKEKWNPMQIHISLNSINLMFDAMMPTKQNYNNVPEPNQFKLVLHQVQILES